jgi:hypothetical protein
MIAYLVLPVLMLVAVVLLAVRLRRDDGSVRSVADLLAHSKPVDLQSFHNLVDEKEEAFLRSELSAADFRRLQRKRMLAALEYVRCTSHNSKVLLKFGQAARGSSDPAISKAALELVQSALNLRVYSLLALCAFSIRIVVPAMPIRCSRLMQSYNRMRDCAGGLVRIEGPAYASQVDSSI